MRVSLTPVALKVLEHRLARQDDRPREVENPALWLALARKGK